MVLQVVAASSVIVLQLPDLALVAVDLALKPLNLFLVVLDLLLVVSPQSGQLLLLLLPGKKTRLVIRLLMLWQYAD